MSQNAPSPGRLRIVFMGTPDFALPSFEALCDSEAVLAVVTQPDRPKGRKGILSTPPIKVAAFERNLPVFQPERLKNTPDMIATLAGMKLDLIVVVAFGQILPEAVLKIPKYGCINVHASLLPKYRGAGPIQWAIIQGESETGVTTMEMDASMDTGPILLKKALPIDPDETAVSLSPKLATLGASLLLETLTLLKEDKLSAQPQDDSKASLAPRLKKEAGLIPWESSALEIYNRWRGLFPWPGLTTYYKNERWKISAIKVGALTGKVGSPGELLQLTENGLEVATGAGYIVVTSLQPEGKREMTPAEYAAGHRIEVGSLLKQYKEK